MTTQEKYKHLLGKSKLHVNVLGFESTPRTEITAGFPGTMKKRGAPTKPEQDKIKSVTPGLRVEVKKWAAISAKYPRQINKMFNEWLNTL